MNIEYRISKDGKCEYSPFIRKRIKELKSNECDTEAAIRNMAEKYAKNHECIDYILRIVYCELTFWYDKLIVPKTTVHMIAYCSLNNVPSNEVFGFCDMYFDYDKYDEDDAIIKVYKLNYCNLDHLK